MYVSDSWRIPPRKFVYCSDESNVWDCADQASASDMIAMLEQVIVALRLNVAVQRAYLRSVRRYVWCGKMCLGNDERHDPERMRGVVSMRRMGHVRQSARTLNHMRISSPRTAFKVSGGRRRREVRKSKKETSDAAWATN